MLLKVTICLAAILVLVGAAMRPLDYHPARDGSRDVVLVYPVREKRSLLLGAAGLAGAGLFGAGLLGAGVAGAGLAGAGLAGAGLAGAGLGFAAGLVQMILLIMENVFSNYNQNVFMVERNQLSAVFLLRISDDTFKNRLKNIIQ